MQTNDFSVVIDDDPVAGTQIRNALRKSGLRSEWFDSARSATELIRRESVSLVVLNVGSGEDSGVNVVRGIRQVNDRITIILLTPIEARQDRIDCITAGADDFLIQPFQLPELLARVEAARLRSTVKPRDMLALGSLRMDLSKRKVERNGRQITLTPTEFRILEILLLHQDNVVTRRMLCELLWNPEWEGVTNVIEVHINRLRSKIAIAGEDRMIHTVRGSGYILKIDSKVGQSGRHNGHSVGTQARATQDSAARPSPVNFCDGL